MIQPPFIQYAWLVSCDRLSAREGCHRFHRRQVNHHVGYIRSGRAHVRWIHHGRDEEFCISPGNVIFLPADNLEHTFLVVPEADLESVTVMIPADHLATIAAEEVIDREGLFRMLPPFDDAVLRSCMEWMMLLDSPAGGTTAAEHDDVARRLVMRLLELLGRRSPAWEPEHGVFTGETMHDLIHYIDEHLQRPPTLTDIATMTGLSPSHAARKFRRSVGTSLERFVNRRRLLRALGLLSHTQMPLTRIALDLGFSSQSHFTRLFSESTGTSPSRYRRALGAPRLPR